MAKPLHIYAKDGITVASILDVRRAKIGNVYPIKIRVTYKRDRQPYSTGKDLSMEDWERLPAAKSLTLSDIRASVENSFNIIRDAVEELASNAIFSFAELDLRLGRGVTSNLREAFEAKIERTDNYGHKQMLKTSMRSVERFAGKNIPLENVTADWLKKFEKFLLSEDKKQTTIAMHLRAIRAIINESIQNGWIKGGLYPFAPGKFSIKEGTGGKRPITPAQVGQIARFDNGSPAMRRYRDYWLFLYYCNGINIADFVKLKYKNIVDEEICFIRQKTENTVRKQQHIRVAINSEMQKIIDTWGNPKLPDHYIFPILAPGDADPEILFKKKQYFTRALNKRMKMIGEELGFEIRVSSYTARHTFATVLKNEGVPVALIKESLGHKDIKTTENYLASFEKGSRKQISDILLKFGEDQSQE